MHRSTLNSRLETLYREAIALAENIAVANWAHHYREFNKMADRAASISMDTQAYAQVLTTTFCHFVRSVKEIMDQDVAQWLETSLAVEIKEHAGPAITVQESAASTRQLQRRQAAVVRGLA